MATENSAGAVRPSAEKAKPQPTARPAGGGSKTPGVPTSKRIRKYVDEVKVELSKATWPSREELRAQTQVVLGLLVLIGVFIAGWDAILGLIFKGLLNVLGVHR